jgi:hypothetical protein
MPWHSKYGGWTRTKMIYKFQEEIPRDCVHAITDLESEDCGTQSIQINIRLNGEVIEWLEENCIASTWNERLASRIWFENEVDCVAFKLRWHDGKT